MRLAVAVGIAVLAMAPAAAWAQHAYIAPDAQDEGMTIFIDMTTVSRNGDVAEAEGLMVPLAGDELYPNYATSRMQINCATRMGGASGLILYNLAGDELGRSDAVMPPERLDPSDQPIWDLFCRRGADRGQARYATVAEAVAFARRPTAEASAPVSGR